jgi:histidine triad (HIT) family protein
METTLFTKIIRGEIPCHKIYEDDKTFAFLDIHPIQPGHALVIPKVEVEFVWDLADEDYLALTDTVKKVALRLRQVLEVPYIGEKILGTDVPHAHVHLIPFRDGRDFHGLPDTNPDDTTLAEIASRLAF